ncbi:MAG: CcmD family protein [Rhodothermales bacterium]
MNIQDAQDASQATAYDSLWAGSEVPTQALSEMEQVMLSNDKLYVVLAVVLIIWIGIVILLLRNDARLKSVERTMEEQGTSFDDGL